MGSDRARITYDESRQYRAVVMQQGRVTVEADWNEEEQVVNEEMRKEALDFVGPNGTPDNGYRVIETQEKRDPPWPPLPPFDFWVDKGTMYVGGMRAFSADPIQYGNQTDWLDHQDDPDWVEPSTLVNAPPQNEFIYLYLREQEVSAVEDSALREVALGGPDTAQRLRLIQHIVRVGTNALDCPTALAEAEAKWAAEGLNFDDLTMRLLSPGTLQVSFTDAVTTPDPCEPQAHGGYLGADNQLIRVQISGSDPYRLVWGFDNASFLYRVTVEDLTTLRFQSRPVDDFHKPRAQQAVEVLRSAAQLSTKTNDYIASAMGTMEILETAYVSDTQSITLPTPLSAEYKDPDQTPVVFLRVWEEEKPFTPGTPVPLGATGLQVTLQTPPFHIGDYWLFSVRPDTATDPKASTQVFPHRYLEGQQPPDGPRLWACPLAVIEWIEGPQPADRVLQTVEDCRNLFDDLVTLTKRELCACCDITVRPEDLTGTTTLQSIIDGFKNRDFVTLCLTPGTYSLSAPLRLGPEHSNLTMKSCHGGVIIQAAAGREDQFPDGLIVLTGTDNVTLDNVTLRGLQFNLPLTPLVQAGGTIANIEPSVLRQMVGPLIQETISSVGVRTQDCTRLTIKDCRFQFSTNSDQDIQGWGIKAGGQCLGLTVQGNTFVREGNIQQPGESPFRNFVGYELSSSIQFAPGVSAASTAETIPAGTMVRARLQDASFQDNLFANITSAAIISADNAGTVKIERNTVRDCVNGFLLDSDVSSAIATLVDEVSVNKEQITLAQRLRISILGRELDPARQIGRLFAKGYPLPRGFDMSHAIQVGTQKASTAAEVGRAQIQAFFDKALSAGSGDVAAEKVNVKEGATKPTETTFPGSLGRLNALYILLAAFERVALIQGESLAGPRFSCRVSDNDISTTIPAFGNALSVTDFIQEDIEINMSANRVQDQSDGNTVQILGVGHSTITGNQISNNSSAGGALLVFGPGINMSTNTLQNQGGLTVTIIAETPGAALTGNQISNNSSTDDGALLVFGPGINMSTNTLQSQGNAPTVTIEAGTEGAKLTDNRISNNSPIIGFGGGSALQFSGGGGIVMSANTLQSQEDGPTVTIIAGPAGGTLTGNRISNNSSAGDIGPSGGSALRFSGGGGIVMSANTLQNHSQTETVFITGVMFCTVTGNIILNQLPEGGADNRPKSITINTVIPLLPTSTVTGNVCGGSATLPPRPFPPPMDKWDILNTIQDVGFA